MRILVFGRHAFLARRVAEIVGREPGRTVVVAGRDGSAAGARFAPEQPESVGELEGFDAVVSCDSELPPEQTLRRVLERPLLWVQMGAEPEELERRLLERRRNGQAKDTAGTVVLGMGLTPGLTNLMARELVQPGRAPGRLEVGLRFGGARGVLPGLLGLLVHSQARSPARYEDGERVEVPGLGLGTRLPFHSGEVGCVHVPLPETLMLHWSTGASDTAAYLALPSPVPSVLGRGLPRLLHALPSWWRLPAGVRHGLREARSLLELAPVPVELTVIADRAGERRGTGQWLSLRGDDLVRASAFSVSAALALLGEARRRPGLFLPDELLSFGEVLERMQELAAGTLRLEVRRGGQPVQLIQPRTTSTPPEQSRPVEQMRNAG